MTPSETLLASLAVEFPRFTVVHKQASPLSRAIDLALKVITLGAQRRYLSHYHTVIGYRLYLPASWAQTADPDRVIVLRHERVHLRQRRRLGMLPFAFLYLVPFAPLGLAYGRARLEWEAYRETLAATAELRGIAALDAPAMRQEIVGRFLDGSYGWMWPFRKQVEGWYASAVSEIAAELAGASTATAPSPPNLERSA